MIDTATKLAALFAICTYILGFITVNQYLNTLGASDFSLVRGRYISIGLSALTFIVCLGLLPVVAALGGYLAVWQGVLPLFRGPTVNFADLVFNIVLLLGALCVIPAPWCLLTWRTNIGKRKALYVCLRCILLTVLGSIVLIVLRYALWPSYRLFYQELPSNTEPPYDATLSTGYSIEWSHLIVSVGVLVIITVVTFLLLVATAVTLMSVLHVFAGEVLPTIPVRFGGAQPTDVRLAIDQNAVGTVTQLNVPVTDIDSSKPNQVTDPVSMLWIGDQTYIIRLSGGQKDRQIVQITKAAVSGITSSPKRPGKAHATRFGGNTIPFFGLLLLGLVVIAFILLTLLRTFNLF